MAVRAGDVGLGREPVAAAVAASQGGLPDELHEPAQAQALLAQADGRPVLALQAMQPLKGWLFGVDDRGLSLRVRCSGLQPLSELQEAAGRPDEALVTLRQWQRCQARREGQPLTVALIDLDHFKSVDDGYGHDVGDRVLATFVALLLADTRDSDVVCRCGGEEFCLLMPNTPASAAVTKLRALLLRWSQTPVSHRSRSLIGHSFTAGLVDSTASGGSTAAQRLSAADQALLAGKHGGRAPVRLAVTSPEVDAA